MTHSIRLAQRSEKDIFALSSLWKNTFGDKDGFISKFIGDYLIPGYNVPVVCRGDDIVSAFYMLDFPLFSQTHQIGNAAYLFAAATDDKYRRQGYMGELINYSLELYKNRGRSAVFLMPAEDPLFDYYSRFGFIPVYSAAKPEFNGSDRGTGQYTLIPSDLSDDETFSRVYELYASSAIKYPLAPLKDENFYRRAAESYTASDGSAFGQISASDKNFCYIFYTIRKNILSVDDIILEESTVCGWNEVCEIIAGALDFTGKITITAPDFKGVNKNPRAMICPLNGEVKDICGKIAEKNSPNYINMFMNY